MTHLEENALLELEVLSHDVGDVGRLDWEGDGNVSLLQDVVHLDVKKMVKLKTAKMMKMNVRKVKYLSPWSRRQRCPWWTSSPQQSHPLPALPGPPRWNISCTQRSDWAKQHLSNISFKLCSIVFAKAPNSGLSGSLRLGFHSLTFHIWIDGDQVQNMTTTHHLELSIDFIFLEDWLLFLLLFDGRLNEIVTVVCDRPHLMKLMTLMLMTMKTKRKILTKKKKNYDISADHHCLSLFVLPHPGLLCRQTDETQVSTFQQQQQQQQQHQASTASYGETCITINNLRPAVGIDRVEGEESTRLLDFALASTFSNCRCWHAGTIQKYEKKMWPALCASIITWRDAPRPAVSACVCISQSCPKKESALVGCKPEYHRQISSDLLHIMMIQTSWRSQMLRLHSMYTWLRNDHNNLRRFVLWWWFKITSYMCTRQGQMLCVQLS